jgi:hypothetical protein
VACEDGGVLRVPVLVFSFEFSGEAHSFAVGDRQSWPLVAHPPDDFPIPEHLHASLDVEVEPTLDAMGLPAKLLRSGGLTAYWDAFGGEEPPCPFRSWFAKATSEDAPDDMPNTCGVISELRAVAVFDAHPPGGQAKVLGVRTVRNTDERGPVDSVYRVDATVPEDLNLEDGVWRAAGWLVTFEVSE